MDGEEYEYGPKQFDCEGERQYVEQGGYEGIHTFGVNHVLEHELAVNRCAAAEEECEKAGECHYTQCPYLNEKSENEQSERCERHGDIDRRESGYTYSTCTDKKGVDIVNAPVGAFGQHEQE